MFITEFWYDSFIDEEKAFTRGEIPRTIEGKKDMLRRVAEEMTEFAKMVPGEKFEEWADFPDTSADPEGLRYLLGEPERDLNLATFPPTPDGSCTLSHVAAWEPSVALAVAQMLATVADRIGGKAWSGSAPALAVAKRWDESRLR